ncbi:DUF11 domain-containing protein [Leifsonia poae]|uniref:DUF11 domain-containing protein n=1 Tax=Leifsonia poae TaxID=110933 RepID=UPI00403E67A5
MTKTDGVTAAVTGQTLAYTITVTNPLAFEALANVAVSDSLPAGVTFVSANGGGVNTAGTVSWTIPSIAAGGSAQVHVTVTVDDSALTSLTNTATASVSDPDSAATTMTATAADTDTVDRLSLTKTVSIASTGRPRPAISRHTPSSHRTPVVARSRASRSPIRSPGCRRSRTPGPEPREP